MRLKGALAGLCLCLSTAPLAAQPLAREPAPVVLRPAQETEIQPDFLLSAVMPGAAQLRAGDGRWVPYAALEVWSWLSYLQHRRDGRRLAQRYRDVAWEVARRISAGERRDTAFLYYEAMADDRYPASGAFDTNPDVEGIQPEQASGTYNGHIWDLARDLYLRGGQAGPGDPDYEAAIAYYQRRAIPDSYAWAWGVSRLEQDAFRRLIGDSDEAYRTAKQYLGLILANHITSTVDALVTARLRQLGADAVEFETVPSRGAQGLRLEHGIRITF